MKNILIDARGEACPMPVIRTKQAIESTTEPAVIEVQVDNEIAVKNIQRLAENRGTKAEPEKTEDGSFMLRIRVNGGTVEDGQEEKDEAYQCTLPVNTVVVISSDRMGDGDEKLGRTLMKGFLYALSRADRRPSTVLFLNSGAYLTCAGSVSVEDLKEMETQGTEILTCGTCLDYYHLTDRLSVGSVTNMYTIVEKMTGADKVIRI